MTSSRDPEPLRVAPSLPGVLPTGSALAGSLILAHRSGRPEAGGATPQTLAEALAAQAQVAEALGATVAGWKVGIHPEHGPVAAPLFGTRTLEGPASWPLTSGLHLEVEIAVRLGRDLAPGPQTRASVLDAIESMSVGVELVRTRLAAGFDAPFLTFLADNLGNAGYVIGRDNHLWHEPGLAARTCILRVDGKVIYAKPALHPLGDPIAPLLAYAASQQGALGGLRAGQIVTTGSVCGLIPVPAPGTLLAEIEGLGAVEIRTFDAKPA